MIEIFDTVEQGSDEWFKLRRGLPTASNFATIMASGRDGGDSKTRAKLMKRLAGEIVWERDAETYTNKAMERGKEMEAEARELYAFTRQVELKRVGFVRNGIMGCSPDSFVGDDGILEVKTEIPELLIDRLLGPYGKFPPEHRPQCQGNLLVTGRKWVDLMIFYSGGPPFIVREERDEAYIREIEDAVKVFEFDLRQLVKRIRAYGA